ncbi:hypothetical protein [Synechococcus sp. CCY9202]|uniref:hypothetical protein n=1 Tax=Synechococcus sp. CCY9202 TaxID=174698 RepID=UPI002B1F88C9|nr:hypothetical protein [Synechococcus sp. CCY9202]
MRTPALCVQCVALNPAHLADLDLALARREAATLISVDRPSPAAAGRAGAALSAPYDEQL